jgi:two-component system, chemotaxis family, CheB/CheR fusion protein
MAKNKRAAPRTGGANHSSQAGSAALHKPVAISKNDPVPVLGDPEDEEPLQTVTFPVVGVGASAGGLEAFTRLLQHLPADTGMAFVFIQHLAPQHPSLLASLLSRTTAMPVREVQHGTPVQPNHVYIIPPNTLMSIAGNMLKLEPRPEERGAPRPIDYFFHSLAVDRKANAIGVVLSGADSDGSHGLQAIRGEGGIAIVQTELSAKHPDMPRNAIAAGTIDLILSPEEIAGELDRIGKHIFWPGRRSVIGTHKNAGDESRMHRVFALLRTATRVDFRGYRRETIRRRINRRIMLRRQQNLETYMSLLESDPSELLALYEDMLVNVTGFFRDPEVFVALGNNVLPRIMHERSGDLPVRVWVPGCATGEEVYSLAMCLIEARAQCPTQPQIQVFGTDLSERNIVIARTGTYPASQVSKVSPERQARFFTPVEKGFQIAKQLREMCVFARHNLLVDPPFSRLDLISCRNVLIYFEPGLQNQVAAIFHYALQPNGVLVLGPSESLSGFPDLFSPLDKPHKLFTRRTARVRSDLIGRGSGGEKTPGLPLPPAPLRKEKSFEMELEEKAARIILSEYGPSWVIVNEDNDILHSHGDTGPYLRLAPGRATLSLLKMARECIQSELRKLLTMAKNATGPVSTLVPEREGGEIGTLRVEIRRIPARPGERQNFLVLFLGRAKESPAKTGKPSKGTASPRPSSVELKQLRQDLILNEQRLQSIIDERDAANEDLTSANEEIQSSNEELQSINEELETSKEELQSSNEELNTVNEELQNRVQELGRLNDDLANFLKSSAMPMLMIDNDLRIRRLTSSAEQVLGFQGDMGRPISDMQTSLGIDDLEPRIRRVLETLKSEESEVQDLKGCWHVLHIRPYRTGDNRIEGAVLILIDIDQARRLQMAAEAARKFSESVVESTQVPFLVLHNDLRVRMANRAFCKSYDMQPSEVENQFLYEVGAKQWALPGLQDSLERLATTQGSMEPLEFNREYPLSGEKTVSIHACRIVPDGDNQILLAVEDVTAQKRAELLQVQEQKRLQRNLLVGEAALQDTEASLLHTRKELRALTAGLLTSHEEERRRVSGELHDDLSQRVAKIQFDVETLSQQLPTGMKDGKRRLRAIGKDIAELSNDLRRIAYQLHPSTLDHLGLAVAMRTWIREFSEREGLSIQFAARRVPSRIPAQVASSLFRIVQEALRNVAKHAGKTSVTITLTGSSRELSLSVRDQGIGFAPSAVPFGLGLIGMKERARLVRGEFSLRTRPGHGVAITIRVPLH